MKILIIGSGAREHALAWKAAKSPLIETIFVAPGNAGTKFEPAVQNVDINIKDIRKLLKFAQHEDINLTIVGPEEPLIEGIVDIFNGAGLKIFGPTKAAAQIEGSKTFAKDFLVRNHIPTAEYRTFKNIEPALSYIREKGPPIVIKADGLAKGKGVVVAKTLQEAEIAIQKMLVGNVFGKAGNCIVVEEFLEGEEVSFIVMVDGNHILPMVTSKDYKRVGEGDTGENTGGMGAYSPAPVITDQIYKDIMNRIIFPTVNGMKFEGNSYTGFLYTGLIIDNMGLPKVIEFNCRLGDPETQTIMLRLQSDIIELCLAGINGELDKKQPQWDPRPSLAVVIATQGYPGKYIIGEQIKNLTFESVSYGKIFHAGTSMKNDKVITNGGRVLCVASLGNDINEACRNVYSIIKPIYWKGSFYRKDIGYYVPK